MAHVADDGVSVTELRVHGVGGATPVDMLEDPAPRLVAGDRIAGFYRGADAGGRHVEAYSWGGLTSRQATRAVWLILLPFALANLAGWMLRGTAVWPHRLLRLLALALTVTFVLWVASIWLDLVAYQCGAQPACTAGRWWLAPLRATFIAGAPARRLTVAALVPLALIGLLYLMGRASRARYEMVEPPASPEGGTPGDGTPGETAQPRRLDLAHPRFWDGQAAGVLSHLHLGAAVATITVVLASTSAALDPYAQQPMTDLARVLLGASLVVGLVVVAAAVVLVLTGQTSPLEGSGGQRPRVRRLLWLLPLVAFASLLLAAVVLVWWGPGTLDSTPRQLPGLRWVVGAVFAADLAPLIVAGVCMAAARLFLRRRQSFRGGWLVPATLANLMMNALFAGAAMRTAMTLGREVPSGQTTAGLPGPVIVYPPIYGTLAVGLFTLLLAFTLGAAGWWLAGWLRSRGQLAAEAERQFQSLPDHADLAVPPSLRQSVLASPSRARWLRGIARWWSWSAAVDRVDAALAAGVSAGLVAASVYLGWGYAIGGEPLRFQGFWTWPLTVSTLLLGFIPLAALLVFTYAYRDPEWRRRVGMIWDVATFWPREFHPLAPPCYAERAVPDLAQRITALTADPNQRVIVSAHSQGTVLAVAALLQVDPSVLPRVALVTYGSPLTRLYRRAFPAYLGGGRLSGLWHTLQQHHLGEVTRWKNFWRRTDFIGGPVFTAEDQLGENGGTPFPARADELLLDPPTCHYVLPDPPPRVRSHFDYADPASPPGTEDLHGFLATLTTRLASPPAADRTGPSVPDRPR